MRKMLVVDAGDILGSTWSNTISGGKSVHVWRAPHFLQGPFDEVLVVDYGDEQSQELVTAAVRYRAEHRQCRVSVTRVLQDEWSDTEALARLLSAPGINPRQRSISLSRLGAVMGENAPVDVCIEPDAVLFEYAA